MFFYTHIIHLYICIYICEWSVCRSYILRHFGSYIPGKLRGTRHKGRNSAVKFSHLSWARQNKKCLQYDFMFTLSTVICYIFYIMLLSIKLLVPYALTKGRLPSILSLDQFKHMTTKAYTLASPGTKTIRLHLRPQTVNSREIFKRYNP